MKRSQTGSPCGSARSNPRLRRLIRYAQRPGPYHAVQGGILNPHKYPSYVIAHSFVFSERVLLEHSDTEDGDVGEQIIDR